MKNRLKFLSLLLAVFAVACNTPEEPEQPQQPEQPEQPEQPADPNAVTMTDIEILDMQGTYADFSVVVRNMDSFGYMVIPTEEYTEKSVAEVIAGSGQFSLDDGNFSWEEEMTIVFGVDTTPLTDYTVVAAAKNSTSEVLKVATFTTPEEDLQVEKLSFNPTNISVVHEGTADHYLTLSTMLYELRVHLVGEGFGGVGNNFGARYDNCDEDTTTGFVAEGTYFKELNIDDTWTTYGAIDLSIGNIDLYENVVTGKWEIYGSFCFATDETGKSFLTIEIEMPTGKPLAGAERTDPYKFDFDITKASAEKNPDNGNIWSLTLTQDKNNTVTFEVDLGEDLDYIPSGTYTNNDFISCSMVVNNVRTSINDNNAANQLSVEYNPETKESIISAVAYVSAGTSYVNIDSFGPYNLYEEQTFTDFEVYTEGESINSMAIWTTWDDSGYYWLECLGTYFNINLYFMTGTDVEDHLPAGRYYLRSSAPADGSLWIDCTRSNATRIRTDEGALQFVCDNDTAYIDVTAEYDEVDEFWRHSIVGTLETTNGKYQILLNYVKENPSIY